MHHKCRELGLVMGQKFGTCLLFGAERICTWLHRHQIVGWLIDQPETENVGIGQLEHLGDVFLRSNPLSGNDDAADQVVWRAAANAVARWVQYLQGRLP